MGIGEKRTKEELKNGLMWLYGLLWRRNRPSSVGRRLARRWPGARLSGKVRGRRRQEPGGFGAGPDTRTYYVATPWPAGVEEAALAAQR